MEKTAIIPFERSFASHERAKNWSDKNKIRPEDVPIKLTKKFIFNCDVCAHSFEARLDHIVNENSWCSYCTNKKLCNEKNCKICFEKSFASSDKAKYWIDIANPRNTFKCSGKKFLFLCDKCRHSFKMGLNIVMKNIWCPFCSNRQLCNEKNCKICFEKSFASSDKAKYWNNKNKISPRDVFKSSNKKYIFNCDCGHTFESTNSHITKGQFCSYCAHLKLCAEKDCISCFENSFASHFRAKYWNNKNKISPRDVFKSSNKKYIFNCNKCLYEFESSLYHITSMKEARWCPICKNKTELLFYNNMIKDYKMLTRQFKTEWCKNKKYLPFDFCLEIWKIIIEIDGRQHFEQVSNWQNPEDTQKNDNYKTKCANENGFSVIRILQEDIWKNKFDWFSEIKTAIQKIIDDKIVQNIYICKKNEYDILCGQMGNMGIK
ncbi:MAG: zinc-ribbon domain-containing protein [Acidimicrobiales bacterium]